MHTRAGALKVFQLIALPFLLTSSISCYFSSYVIDLSSFSSEICLQLIHTRFLQSDSYMFSPLWLICFLQSDLYAFSSLTHIWCRYCSYFPAPGLPRAQKTRLQRRHERVALIFISFFPLVTSNERVSLIFISLFSPCNYRQDHN